MKALTKIVVVVVVVALIGGISVRFTGLGGGPAGEVEPEVEVDVTPLHISVVCALPAEPWLTSAAEKYNADERLVDGRRVTVEIIPMDGLAALNKWARGEFEPVPTAWLAESRAWVEQANVAGLKRANQDIFLAGGEYRAQPVVLSPVVWGIWEEAYATLCQYFGTKQISWDELHQAATMGSWADMGGDPGWGQFKLVIAHPKRDPAGLTAMVGAAGAFYDKPAVSTKELQDPAFLDWLSELFDTVVDFSPFGVDNMLLFGRMNGDAAQIVESYLLVNMEGLQDRWQQPLVIVYPDPIAWFDFPYAIYMGKETTAAEKKAALDFKNFILSADQQQAALEFGLRPASADCRFSGGLISRWESLGVEETIPSASRMREASRSGLDALTIWYIATYEE